MSLQYKCPSTSCGKVFDRPGRLVQHLEGNQSIESLMKANRLPCKFAIDESNKALLDCECPCGAYTGNKHMCISVCSGTYLF